MPILKTPRTQYTRRQDLRKRRKARGSFRQWLDAEVARLSATSRTLRDRLRKLGPESPVTVEAAADLNAAGIVRASITATFGVGTQLAAAPDLQVGAVLKAPASVTYAAPGGADTITITGGSWVTQGINVANQKVRILDEGNPNHELIVTVASATATVLTLVEDGALTDGSSSAPADAEFTVRNSITRSAGSFTTDGFLGNDFVTLAYAADNSGDGRYEIQTPGTTTAILFGDEPITGTPGVSLSAVAAAEFEADSVLTRGAGDFSSDGFADGDTVRIVGAVNAAEHDRDWPVQKVGTTTLTVAGTGFVAEAATASVQVDVISGVARESGPALD